MSPPQAAEPRVPAELAARLRCPSCGAGPLAPHGSPEPSWRCAACAATYREAGAVPVLIPPDSPLHPDRKDTSSGPAGPWRSTDSALQAAYWEEHSGIRDVGHPVVAAFARQRWRHLGRHLPLEDVRTALDVGCGNGVGSVYAPAGIECTGCDGSLALLERHPAPPCFAADATRLPFASESFDLVFAWELLHHVEEPLAVIREMARVARRWVVIFEPNPWNPAQCLFALLDPEHRWVLRFRGRYLPDRVRTAGLEHRLRHHCGWLFPNKTPAWLAALVLRLPFRVPGLGISQLIVARKRLPYPAPASSLTPTKR